MALAVVDVGLDERREVIECLLTFFLQYLLASDEVVALCQGLCLGILSITCSNCQGKSGWTRRKLLNSFAIQGGETNMCIDVGAPRKARPRRGRCSDMNLALNVWHTYRMYLRLSVQQQ